MVIVNGKVANRICFVAHDDRIDWRSDVMAAKATVKQSGEVHNRPEMKCRSCGFLADKED